MEIQLLIKYLLEIINIIVLLFIGYGIGLSKYADYRYGSGSMRFTTLFYVACGLTTIYNFYRVVNL